MLVIQLYLLASASGGWCFPLSLEELDEEVTSTEEYTEASEGGATTEPWNFNEYTSAAPGERTAAAVEDELHALRKVAQILLLLGEQVIPRILGDPPTDRCDQKNDDLNINKRVFMWKAKEFNNS